MVAPSPALSSVPVATACLGRSTPASSSIDSSAEQGRAGWFRDLRLLCQSRRMLRKSGTQRQQPPMWRRCRSLRQVKQLHALMVLRAFLSDPSALHELIFAFAIAIAIRGGGAHARLVFDQIPHLNRFMYNTLIRGAAHTGAPRDALSLYARMARREGDGDVSPDKLTFPFVLHACVAMGAGDTRAQVHTHVVKAGCESIQLSFACLFWSDRSD
ncbi:hypothetical protein ACP70R_006382 [Stipagrostis hirtigluma subsp. patula]